MVYVYCNEYTLCTQIFVTKRFVPNTYIDLFGQIVIKLIIIIFIKS